MTPNTPMTELPSDAELVRTMREMLETFAQIAEARGFKRGDDLAIWLIKNLPPNDASQSLRAPAGEVVAWRLTTREGVEHLFNVEDNARSYAEAMGGFVTPLYASPPSEGVKVKGRLPTIEEIHDLLVLYGDFGSGLEAHHRKADECAGEIIKLFITLGDTP